MRATTSMVATARRLLSWQGRPLPCSRPDRALRSMGAVAEEAAEPVPSNNNLGPTIVPSQSFYDNTVELYAKKRGMRLTLQAMLEIGKNPEAKKVLLAGEFVRKELTVRLAKRLMDLQELPYVVVTNPHIKKLYESYRMSFHTLRTATPITCLETNRQFCTTVAKLLEDSVPLVSSLARGYKECKAKPSVGKALDLDAFLDNMLKSRISRRVIAEHHIALQEPLENYAGVICLRLNLQHVIDKVISRTTDVCFQTYGRAPAVEFVGDTHAEFAYIPVHLEYMLFELLKNASRAVVETHYDKSDLPPIIIRAVEQPTMGTITFKISDQGGGIFQDKIEKVWRYGFTTVSDNLVDLSCSTATPNLNLDGLGARSRDPMAGLGFGLPLTRVYSRYFGGDLQLLSIPNFGTDVFLRITRLEQDKYDVTI